MTTATAARAAAPAPAPAPAPARGARAVFALLVVACFGAFFLTQHLKHSPTAVQEFTMIPYFHPTAENPAEQLSFRVDNNDHVRVQIVNANDQVVATPENDVYPGGPYEQYYFIWDGREQSGSLAPEGYYRVRVTLLPRGRSVVSIPSFKLIRVPRHPRGG